MGYAILENTELIFFGVRTFKRRHSARTILADGQRFIKDLLDAFEPHLFVIEKTFYAKSKRSSLLHVFVEEMTKLARKRGLTVLAYAPTAVKKTMAGDGGATKRRLAELMVERYPYLERFLRTDLRTKEKYWENMFDAVALALTGYEEYAKQVIMKMKREP